MSPYADLKDLAGACMGCTACALARGRTRVVPGEGSESARVMFIGEGPGYHEDQQGRPFVGPAGKLLDELIASIGMKRADVYITNVVKCRPPGNRDPLPGEIEACRQWLDPQIQMLRPRVIVTLGRHSLARFLPKDIISKVHGIPRNVGDHLVFPVHHPAAALHQPSLRKTLEEDFKKIPGLLKASPVGAPQKDEEKPQQLSLF